MPPPANKPTIYFYRKDGCHLCDDMARGLMEFKREWESGGGGPPGEEKKNPPVY